MQQSEPEQVGRSIPENVPFVLSIHQDVGIADSCEFAWRNGDLNLHIFGILGILGIDKVPTETIFTFGG
jgi:hypothetical protein